MSKEHQLTDEQLSLKLFIVLSRALESVKKQVVKDIKRYDLNLTEFAVLELLYHKGEQPIQIIGKKVLLASSSITYVVDKLEEKGLLERIACPNDRRVIFGRLTEKGQELMKEIFPQHEKAMAQIFSSLSKEEKVQAIELVKRIGLYAEKM
mgnify:CR=1 FL=1